MCKDVQGPGIVKKLLKNKNKTEIYIKIYQNLM